MRAEAQLRLVSRQLLKALWHRLRGSCVRPAQEVLSSPIYTARRDESRVVGLAEKTCHDESERGRWAMLARAKPRILSHRLGGHRT